MDQLDHRFGEEVLVTKAVIERSVTVTKRRDHVPLRAVPRAVKIGRQRENVLHLVLGRRPKHLRFGARNRSDESVEGIRCSAPAPTAHLLVSFGVFREHPIDEAVISRFRVRSFRLRSAQRSRSRARQLSATT